MPSQTLNDLPVPPSGKNGWPWTEENPQILNTMPNGSLWPRISIVTPSFNQGQFLEATIRSVLLQGYPNLEYIIMDGGSTDGSVEIIRKYEPWLAYWVSTKDKGQYSAVNTGFELATGDIMAWLNADDLYCPWSLQIIGEIFGTIKEVDWITSEATLKSNFRGLVYASSNPRLLSRVEFFWGLTNYGSPLCKGWIFQEATFWRKTLWEKSGAKLDTLYDLAADFDLWAKFWKYSDLYTLNVPLSIIRQHDERRGRKLKKQYILQAAQSLQSHGGRLITRWQANLLRLFLHTPYIRNWLRTISYRVCFDIENDIWKAGSHRFYFGSSV